MWKFWNEKNRDENLDRNDAFSIGQQVYYMQDNSIKKGEVMTVGIKEKSSGSIIKYSISGQNYNDMIPHKRVSENKQSLIESRSYD